MNEISSNYINLYSTPQSARHAIVLNNVSAVVRNNTIIGNATGYGIGISNSYNTPIPIVDCRNNFIDNFLFGFQVSTGNGASTETANLKLIFANNTIVNCSRGFYIVNLSMTGVIPIFRNNIVDTDVSLYYETAQENPLLYVDCQYSYLTATTNIILPQNANNYSNSNGFEPGFINREGNLPVDFKLRDSSICIDTGDPNLDGDKFDYTRDADDRDPDLSRMDMGCFPYTHDYESQYYHDGFNWVCFPMLRGNTASENVLSVLANPAQNNIPYLSGFQNIEYYRNYVSYSYGDNLWFYTPQFETLLSIYGYKVDIEPTNPQGYQTFKNYGTRVPANAAMSLVNSTTAPEGNWVGYFRPKSMNIVDAFGDDFYKITCIKGENWMYASMPENPKGITDPVPVVYTTAGKTLEYGKSYIVTTSEDIPNFHWRENLLPEKPILPIRPTHFTYIDKSDYKTVELISKPTKDEFEEVGVFENGVCVGAAVVDSLPLQIRVYTDEEAKSESELTIMFYSTAKGERKAENVLIWDNELQCFGNIPILSGSQDYSIIKLGGIDDQSAVAPKISQNYPNPFARSTNFSCFVPKSSKTILSIYNIRGQEVKTILDENKEANIYHLSWDGRNDAGKRVTSGIYFYRFETCGKQITNKMILLK